MEIKIDDYAYNRKLVDLLIKKKGEDKYQEFASEFAVVSCCPIFVVYYFIGEIRGFDEWTVTRMKSLAKFYGYTLVSSTTDEGHSIGFDKTIFLERN